MDFWFEFFNIHMNEQATTCHGLHGFKWQNINISLISHFFSMVWCIFWLVGLWVHLMDVRSLIN